MPNKQKSVSFTDTMVLIGICFGILYWITETLYFAFASANSNFWDILFGAGIAGIGIKIIVICFFIILGAHAQYNLNKRKKMESEIASLAPELRRLQEEIKVLREKSVHSEK